MTEERMRLQKFLSQAEVCSRRKAEELIADGQVRVNGKVAELGQSVIPGEDVVKIGKKIISIESRERIVLMMNKPRGYLCTNLDPNDAQTVFQLIPENYAAHKLFCVGRLDKDSEGLLLITNDGDLANKIIHPSSDIVKRYEVTLNREYDPALTPKLLKGVKIKTEDEEEEYLRFTNVIRFPDGKKLEIHLNQGRKREIRRLLEVFGFYVKSLRRFQIGGLILKKMPAGDCRKLTQKEINQIFSKHGNADPSRASSVKKQNKAALRGEKASAPSRTLKKANKKFEEAKERQAVIEKKIRIKRDVRRAARAAKLAENAFDEMPAPRVPAKATRSKTQKPAESAWQKQVRPHVKNSRTRSYSSRKRA